MAIEDIFTLYESVVPPKSFGNVDRFKLPKLRDDTIIDMPVSVSYTQPSIRSDFDWLEMEDTIDPPFSLEQPKADTEQKTPTVETPQPSPVRQSDTPSYQADELIKIDIEDLLRQEGITSVNGKKIKFGSKTLRAQNASFGVKNSNHKKQDPYTGNAMARDISIIGGTQADYAEFRRVLLNNPRVRAYMDAKGWGILNEITPSILKRTRGTGPHFHFGPDTSARRTWRGWLNNPDIPITQAL